MTRDARVITIIVVSILILSPIVSTNWTVDEIPELDKKSNISNSFIESLLEDPFLDQEHEVIVNGTSGEFSSNYQSSSGSTDISYIEIEWTHTENTELDFRGVDPEGIMPDYNDFIYTYQEFEFPYETRPSDAEISLNYSVYLTGDFVPGVQVSNNLMFRVYVWVIDSSGNWYRVYESREAVYSEEYQQKYVDLNYVDLVDIFSGMIEEEGVQEDPTDTAILAIGLAPTYRFESYAGAEPWTFYDGSVSLRVSYADMYIIMDIPNDPSTLWQPEYNETYGSTLGDVFPLHENATDEVWDDCYGMKIDSDGSVYVTGNSRSSYELREEEGLYFRRQFLLKYSPSLDLLWEVTNDNMTQVKSIYIQGGYIYTTGYIVRDGIEKNLIVTKWSLTGERVWQSEWGGDFSQTGVAIGVQSNGSIYVVCSDYNNDDIGYYYKTQILKYDNNGNRLWNRTNLYAITFRDTPGDLYIFDDFFVFHLRSSFGGGAKYYFNGTQGHWVWGDVIVPEEEGGYYAAWQDWISGTEPITHILLTHVNSTGYPIWRTNYSAIWPNGWFYSLKPINMVMTPDNKLVLLAVHTTLSLEYLLLTFDLDGNLLENRTIGDEYWPYPGGWVFMDVGKAGLVYFAFMLQSGIFDVCVQAYKMYLVSDGFALTISAVIIIASTVVIVGAGVGIIRTKRRK